jgi:hypothetical protein
MGQTSAGDGTSGRVGWMGGENPAVYAALAMKPVVAKEESYCDICYGPSGIAWPMLGGLAGRPFCELVGLGLAFTNARGRGRTGCNDEDKRCFGRLLRRLGNRMACRPAVD